MLSALAWLWQVAGHLLAVLMWADTPQRVAVLTVAVLAVAVVGCLAVGASLAGAAAGHPVVRHLTALREKSWRRVPAAARPGRPGTDQAESTLGGPSGRLISRARIRR